jgi:hypothetical protein
MPKKIEIKTTSGLNDTGYIVLTQAEYDALIKGTLGNKSGNVPISNGTVNANLNADMVDGYHVQSNGNSGSAWNYLSPVKIDGVMEVGRYIDFHNTSADGIDYAVRLQTNGTSVAKKIWFPDASGTIALTSDIPSIDLSNYVTTNTAQTISAVKTFSSNANFENGATISSLEITNVFSGLTTNEQSVTISNSGLITQYSGSNLSTSGTPNTTYLYFPNGSTSSSSPDYLATQTWCNSNFLKVYPNNNYGTFENFSKLGFAAAMLNQADGPIGSNWTHCITLGWNIGDENNWISQLAFGTANNIGLYYRTKNGQGTALTTTNNPWIHVIDSSNIGSQAVSYANNADSATHSTNRVGYGPYASGSDNLIPAGMYSSSNGFSMSWSAYAQTIWHGQITLPSGYSVMSVTLPATAPNSTYHVLLTPYNFSSVCYVSYQSATSFNVSTEYATTSRVVYWLVIMSN